MANDGETMETVRDFILGGSQIMQMVIAAMKLETLAPWKKSYDQTRQHIKNRITLPTNIHILKAIFFSSSHVQM